MTRDKLGHRQRIVLGDMLANGGWWPHDVKLSDRERHAMGTLVKRGWVIECEGNPEGTHHIPRFHEGTLRRRLGIMR